MGVGGGRQAGLRGRAVPRRGGRRDHDGVLDDGRSGGRSGVRAFLTERKVISACGGARATSICGEAGGGRQGFSICGELTFRGWMWVRDLRFIDRGHSMMSKHQVLWMWV